MKKLNCRVDVMKKVVVVINENYDVLLLEDFNDVSEVIEILEDNGFNPDELNYVGDEKIIIED